MNDVEYVKNSLYRQDVIRSLDGHVKMPSEISMDMGIKQSNASHTIRQLRDKGRIECINPEVRKGGLYRLTEAGKEVAKKI